MQVRFNLGWGEKEPPTIIYKLNSSNKNLLNPLKTFWNMKQILRTEQPGLGVSAILTARPQHQLSYWPGRSDDTCCSETPDVRRLLLASSPCHSPCYSTGLRAADLCSGWSHCHNRDSTMPCNWWAWHSTSSLGDRHFCHFQTKWINNASKITAIQVKPPRIMYYIQYIMYATIKYVYYNYIALSLK